MPDGFVAMATRDFRKLALLCGGACECEETNEETQQQRWFVYKRQSYRNEKGWVEVGPQPDGGKQHVALMVDNKERHNMRQCLI
jgi:hypothetical protein